VSARVVVTGAFDDLRFPGVRFLHEASRLGKLHVSLWSDEVVESATGRRPAFPFEERRYLVENARYVSSVSELRAPLAPGAIPGAADGRAPDVWVELAGAETPGAGAACAARSVRHVLLDAARLAAIPAAEPSPGELRRPSVVVTGCYDWLHSGHIRFFEEVSALGSLIVVAGNDANVRHLKGEGHPLFPETVRQYMVQSVRTVSLALVSTGWGWLDAEPEIDRLKPDKYAVNRDGDKPEKKAFCEARGIEYLVLERVPRPGLTRRSSTDLRGF
jgi:cytidyltransferase-like protein